MSKLDASSTVLRVNELNDPKRKKTMKLGMEPCIFHGSKNFRVFEMYHEFLDILRILFLLGSSASKTKMNFGRERSANSALFLSKSASGSKIVEIIDRRHTVLLFLFVRPSTIQHRTAIFFHSIVQLLPLVSQEQHLRLQIDPNGRDANR
jgi:hypothetical protein